ncbi:MAG: SurA N-terminal domain-containing protein [Deltaproteobacteria bacterium]|nr:SurA N-terminal domain-containing protein [Deltaproteobacteria bacterium]
MLDLMRRHARSWMVNVMIGAIAITFIFWGAGSFRRDRELNYVATVNDQKISMIEYQEAYRTLYEQVRDQYREIWSDDLLETLNLKKRAIENLIDQHLVSQKASAFGIKVSTEDLQQRILSSPAFQFDGIFNAAKYQTILARNKMSPETYEQLMRRELVNLKLRNTISKFAKISEDEVKEYYRFIQDRVDVEFVTFEPETFQERVKPAADEMKAFFEKDKEQYRVPDRVKVAYLVIRPKDFEDKAVISGDEIEEYYELNLDDYKEPEQAKARHILFKVDENASPEDEELVKAQAELVLMEVKRGKDFAELAKKYSQGPTAKNGGDLGWFAQDQMVPPFSEAAFNLNEGEISGLVRTRFGFHIIKAEGRKPAGVRTQEEVKDEISRMIGQNQAKDMAADRAIQVYEQASLSQEFEVEAKKLDLTPVITNFFAIGEPVEKLGLQKKFNEMAHSLNPGEIGPIIDLPDGHYIIKGLDSKKSYIPTLKEVEEAVTEDIVEEKTLELALAEAKKFLDAVGKGGNWENLVKEFKLKPDTTGPFSRIGWVPKLGNNPELANSVFSLTKPGQVGSDAYKTDKGYSVFRLKKILAADDKKFEKERKTFAERLRLIKGQQYLLQWLKYIRSTSTIKIEDGMI